MARFHASCVLLCFVLSSCVSAELNILNRFIAFIEEFEKPYKTDIKEFQRRFDFFKQNLDRIEKLNRPYGEGSAVFGITRFSDFSEEEFKAQFLSDVKKRPRDERLMFKPEMLADTSSLKRLDSLPQKIDWRDSGVVTAVKNQGQCGACWAFAAAEAMESAYAISHKTAPPDLAVQQLIDCSKEGNKGCEGGDICDALAYVKANGITYSSVYPLTNADGTCYFKPTDQTVKLDNYNCTRLVGREEEVLGMLAEGPVAVAVDASTWSNYVSGVIRFHCESNINHAVDIVGYDLTGPVPYYIVRNSWGTEFGMDGYMYIKYGGNLCGIAESVSDVYMS